MHDRAISVPKAAQIAQATKRQLTELNGRLTQLESGDKEYTISDMERGSYNASGAITTSTNRIRIKGFIPVKKGETIVFSPGTTVNQFLIGYFTTEQAYIADSTWYSNTNIPIEADGYIIIVFRNSTNSTITLSDYDATIKKVSTTSTTLWTLRNDYPFINNRFYSYVSAFMDFSIHMPDPSVEVKLTRLRKNSSNTYAVVLDVGGTAIYAINKLSSAYEEKSYNSFDTSGFYGYFTIDWSKVPNNSFFNNINVVLNDACKHPYVEKPKYDNVDILLPSVINAVVGHEFSIEFYNVVRCSNIEEFQINISPSDSHIQNLTDRIRFVPASVGATTVTISLYKNEVLIKSKSFTLNVVADTQPIIKALFLGDSMTNQGYFISELKNMLGDNLTLYGTRSTTAVDANENSRVVQHEGRAGWSTSNYVNSASLGNISNPFYNNGFDFSYYITNNPTFADVTDVFILLGTNDGYGNGVDTRMKAICDSIKAYNSNIRIHCMLPIPPIRSGYGYGTRIYITFMIFKEYMYNTAKKYITAFEGVSGYSIIPVNVNLNCYYDFPQTEVPVNSRNPQLIPVGNENVHPSKYGYYRFSDMIYADIIANCS